MDKEKNNKKISHDKIKTLSKRKEIFDFMFDYDSQLRSDKDFEKEIKIKHRDESEFYLPSSHLEEDKKRIFIYTEHCGFFWFYKEDLEEMRETIFKYDEEKNNFQVIFDKTTTFNGD